MKNGVVFGALGFLYATYVFLVRPYFTPVFPLFNWAIFGKLLLVLAPLFIVYSWNRRELLVSSDYHMVYLPFLTWLVVSIVIKEVAWHFFQGRGVFGPYGRDKGMANMMVEIEMVCLLSGFYLLRFSAAGRRLGPDPDVVAKRLRAFVLVAVVLVAVVVPPLPD